MPRYYEQTTYYLSDIFLSEYQQLRDKLETMQIPPVNKICLLIACSSIGLESLISETIRDIVLNVSCNDSGIRFLWDNYFEKKYLRDKLSFFKHYYIPQESIESLIKEIDKFFKVRNSLFHSHELSLGGTIEEDGRINIMNKSKLYTSIECFDQAKHNNNLQNLIVNIFQMFFHVHDFSKIRQGFDYNKYIKDRKKEILRYLK